MHQNLKEVRKKLITKIKAHKYSLYKICHNSKFLLNYSNEMKYYKTRNENEQNRMLNYESKQTKRLIITKY